jgi:hypothetical protein
MIVSNASRGFFGDVDWGALVKSATSAGQDLITKELPNAAQAAVQKQVTKVVAPVVQQRATATASEAYSKGSVAALGAAGALLGVLVAGGGLGRRAIAGVLVGAAGAFVGFKFGLKLTSGYG